MHPQVTQASRQAGTVIPLFDIPDPPALPEPSHLTRMVFESPWLASAALMGAGIIVFFWLKSREKTRAGMAWGGALASLACVLVGIAQFVRTSRERVLETTRGLVRSVADADTAALDAWLDESCVLYFFESPTGMGKRAIVELVASRMREGAVYSIAGGGAGVRFEAVQAVARGDTAQAQVKVAVTSAQWGIPHRSWWRLDLKRCREGRWRVIAIMPTAIQGVNDASGRSISPRSGL